VDGAIHEAAGRSSGRVPDTERCATGDAKITRGYAPAKHVIHTVGLIGTAAHR
jgi:O-acetyl-ADP-ribose deacetylase (regulator of RNase III)